MGVVNKLNGKIIALSTIASLTTLAGYKLSLKPSVSFAETSTNESTDQTSASLDSATKQRGSPDVDCAEPVCEDKKDQFHKLFKSNNKRGKKAEQEKMVDCPLDRSELGRATWSFLHTTAAYYPTNPSEMEKRAAEALITGITALYPCVHCREHFAAEVQEEPFDYTSRETFSKSLCTHHNKVNEMLEKEIFDCSKENLEKRWKKGDSRYC